MSENDVILQIILNVLYLCVHDWRYHSRVLRVELKHSFESSVDDLYCAYIILCLYYNDKAAKIIKVMAHIYGALTTLYRHCSKWSMWISSLNPFNHLILFCLYFFCDIKELAQISKLINVGGDSWTLVSLIREATYCIGFKVLWPREISPPTAWTSQTIFLALVHFSWHRKTYVVRKTFSCRWNMFSGIYFAFFVMLDSSSGSVISLPRECSKPLIIASSSFPHPALCSLPLFKVPVGWTFWRRLNLYFT